MSIKSPSSNVNIIHYLVYYNHTAISREVVEHIKSLKLQPSQQGYVFKLTLFELDITIKMLQ